MCSHSLSVDCGVYISPHVKLTGELSGDTPTANRNAGRRKSWYVDYGVVVSLEAVEPRRCVPNFRYLETTFNYM